MASLILVPRVESRLPPRKRTRKIVNEEEAIAKRAAAKLDEGDVRGAIRQLCSSDTFAEPSKETWQSLLAKHPPALAQRPTLPFPVDNLEPLTVSPDQVLRAIRSFPPGSSGGVDGLRPQHLKDMTERQVGESFVKSISKFVNLVLAGGVPVEVRPHFFGATLLAFNKKDGGLRPIAVGLTLRRLVSKVACSSATVQCLDFLKPRQLGVGVKGGTEALAHSARLYLKSIPESHVFVKLDFSNAFNCIRRDVVREAVATHVSSLLSFVDSAYGGVSFLRFGEHIIQSAEGVQQGDPLGPLLFCLAIHPLLVNIQSEFVSGYLDDIGIGGEVGSVTSDIAILERNAKAMGLSLNHAKCEVIGLNLNNREAWSLCDFQFQDTPLTEAVLLGTPIHVGGVDGALAAKNQELGLLIGRLSMLPAHAALFLLRNVFAMPRLLYILRTAPCSGSAELTHYDNSLRSALSSLLNIELSTSGWNQSTLPVRWGGIGIRSAHRLAPSAFLASAAGASDLLSVLLPSWTLAIPDPTVEEALRLWYTLGGVILPSGSDTKVQRCWDEAICKVAADQLREGADEGTTARLLASCAPEAGAWLNAVPCASLGLNLDDETLRIAVGLRLGAPLGLAHQCSCGSGVDIYGHHGLACRRSAGRHLRHNLVNDTILRALQSAGIPAVREPSGLSRTDGKRPDGVTLVPWSRGRCLLWDATCPDTLAPSHLHRSSIEAGAAAAEAELRKCAKYAPLANVHDFVPVVIESLGTWGKSGLSFINDLGRRITSVTGEVRAACFLRQRLSLAVQRGNAAAVRGTFVVTEDSD